MTTTALRVVRVGARAAEPATTFVAHVPTDGGYVTAITRVWDEKSRPTCGRLCDPARCRDRFKDGVCLVAVPFFVDAGSAAGFRDC